MSLWSRTTGSGWLGHSDDCSAPVPVAIGGVGGAAAWSGGDTVGGAVGSAAGSGVGLAALHDHVAFTRGNTNTTAAYCGEFGSVPPTAAMAAHGGVNVTRCRRLMMRLCRLVSACILITILLVVVRDWIGSDWMRTVEERKTWNHLSDSHSPKQVEIGVYYESRCPDSKEFIIQQLIPTMKAVPDIIDLVLVPYGKARTLREGGQIKFRCQHGPEECRGNNLHACAIKLATSRSQTLQFVECLINRFFKLDHYAEGCARSSDYDWTAMVSCSESEEMIGVMELYGNMTEALQPSLTFVPTITMDGSQDNQLQLRKNLLPTLCSHFREKFAASPNGCA